MFKTSDYGIKTLITLLQEEIDRNGEEYPDINVVCKDIIKQIKHRISNKQGEG